MKKKYIIVSSVRNEQDYIQKTLQSMVSQTIKPLKWIIVNDGSTDKTGEYISKYEEKYEWIEKLDLKDRGFYSPGEGIVNAVYKGFENVKDLDWHYFVKMDCDLSFEEDYYEKMLIRFHSDDKLGIASGGIYNVISPEKIIMEKGKADHPWGAAIMFRKKCFEQIGGLQATLGWELAAILKAQIRGWNTRCFFDLIIYHYRITGGRHTGFTKGRFRHGRNLYRFGYPIYYTFLKSLYRIFEVPYLIGSMGILTGYLYGFFKRDPFIYDKTMRKHLRIRLKKIIFKYLN